MELKFNANESAEIQAEKLLTFIHHYGMEKSKDDLIRFLRDVKNYYGNEILRADN